MRNRWWAIAGALPLLACPLPGGAAEDGVAPLVRLGAEGAGAAGLAGDLPAGPESFVTRARRNPEGRATLVAAETDARGASYVNDEYLLSRFAPDALRENVFSLEMLDRICETLLRLRGNMIVPNMIVPGTFNYPAAHGIAALESAASNRVLVAALAVRPRRGDPELYQYQEPFLGNLPRLYPPAERRTP